ncbi:MAG: glycosyltransferase [Gaiellaceae bacterium]
MRVAVDGLAARTGGGVTYLRSVLGAALATDPELELVILVADPTPLAALAADPRVRTVAPLGPRPSVLRRVAFELAMLGRFVARLDADVLLCPSEIAPLRSPVPVVLGFQNPNLWERPLPLSATQRLRLAALRRVARASARRAAECIFVSEHLRQAASIGRGRSEHVLSPPLDPVFSRESEVTSRFRGLRPYVLTVADVYAYKNLSLIVDALARLGRSDLRLVVAGRRIERAEAERLERRADDLGVADTVVFLGPVELDEMPGLYAGAACFVFASLVESFGFPPLEAMACGVPVACARTSVMPSILGAAPEWFDACDSASAADAIARLLDDESAARTAVTRGLEQARRFDPATAGADLVSVLGAAATYHRIS